MTRSAASRRAKSASARSRRRPPGRGHIQRSVRQVHDTNVIATMLAHGVGTVVTTNVADFARFERYVSLVEL